MEVVVIGGGAAGFFGAIQCAKHNPQARVTLLEASHEPLAKVRISGGGRCNVTHACFEPALLVQNYPRGGRALRGAFSRFQPRDMVTWLTQEGVKLKTEADGRMFPTTDNSETIVECLTWAAKKAGVHLKLRASVSKVERHGSGSSSQFIVQLKSGEEIPADRLLLATGSNPKGYEIAAALGHTIESPVPSLFTFNIADAALHSLAGISIEEVLLRLEISDQDNLISKNDKQKLSQTGSLLITHWGLSGPAVLKLSAWGARVLHACKYRTNLHINWLPKFKSESLRSHLLAAKQEEAKRTLGGYCPVNLPKRLWHYLLDWVEISLEMRWADLSNKALERLVNQLLDTTYAIAGKGVFKEEFVTCGGVNLKEIEFKTMESLICPGLYFAGEILDIDGVTGGFNFQSAWTTGWLAGRAIAIS